MSLFFSEFNYVSDRSVGGSEYYGTGITYWFWKLPEWETVIS